MLGSGDEARQVANFKRCLALTTGCGNCRESRSRQERTQKPLHYDSGRLTA